MSDSEDEDHAYYGSALEPIDEDNLPKKKPILIQDQIATDKHGRRRFHGAFTGGFSAGFFNSVGTLEGWSPAAFKSSRSTKAEKVSQRPEDFMDEEDTEEFGIAPTLLRAKPEYSGSRSTKRKMDISDGPIPGDPVLRSILEPANTTIGMKLLMRLGWKPGQGLGPMLTWAEKMGEEVSPEELGLKPDILFPPTPVQEQCVKAKSDRFGLGYSGLNKEPVLTQRFTLFDPLKITEKKNKLSIRGQAFGVGAFEEDDEDIYAKDDMSRYDFALETSASLRAARKKEREKEKAQLAICDSPDCLAGFLPAKNQGSRKKYFPPPEIPHDFDVNASQRKSRFEEVINGDPSTVKGKYILNAGDRAAILGEKTEKSEPSSIATEDSSEVTPDENSTSEARDTDFKPFVSDPLKQKRYEKYLGFIKIGAKDALKNIQPLDMSDWEKVREANEFEQAARLYQPLSGMMRDRFSHGGLLDDSSDPLAPVTKSDPVAEEAWVTAAKEKKFGKLTRFTLDWNPAPIVCKRMNIPEPRAGGTTLAEIAGDNQKRKMKFSVFDFLDSAKNSEDFKSSVDDSESHKNINDDVQLDVSTVTKKEKLLLPEPLLDPKIIEAEDPKEKMDLFKAIFASSDEESDSEDLESSKGGGKTLEMDKDHRNPAAKNVLRNTSPPRGIFANLDLDALKPKPLLPSKTKEAEIQIDQNVNSKAASEDKLEEQEVDPSLYYGPTLPSKPVFVSKARVQNESDSSSSEDEWVEKEKKTSKKKKHSKKHKKDKKKDRHKHKKKKH